MATSDINLQKQTIKWWQSIRFTLVVILIAVSVIPVAVIAVTQAEPLRDRTIEQVTAQLQSISALKTAEIDTWLETAHGTLDTFTQNSFISDPIIEVLTADEVDSDQVALLNEAVKRTIVESIVIDELFIYNLKGSIKIATDTANIGKVVSRQPYFDKSLDGEDFHVHPPFYHIAATELTMIATASIRNEAGEIIGIIAGGLKTEKLSEIMLERSGLGESGDTYLISRENNYFLTPSRFEAEGYGQNRAYTSFGIEQALNEVEGSGLFSDYRNPPVSVIGVYSWIPQLESAMLVEIDEAEALSTLDQAISSILQEILAVGAIVILIGIYLGQRISRPITQLAQTAQAIAGGDFEKQVDVQGTNEIALLGNTFNQMTGQLASNIQELDENIQKLDKTNRDLGIQTAMAREATRLKSEFLATMSHELRTPLNAITGFTGILLFDAEDMDEDNVHMLQRVESNAKRLLTLIDDVLDLSKIEAGRVEIVDEPIQIRSLVKQWLGETSVLAENKNLPLYTDVSVAFPETIYGDSARLTQITKNLLSNAIKFTSEGSVSLQVTAIDSHWHIIVKDTGIGIPPHARNYIFDEFRQVDGTSRRVYGGTGLGLAITRNLALMMNGTVTVDSELGQGSTFTVRLPLRLVSLGETIPI